MAGIHSCSYALCKEQTNVIRIQVWTKAFHHYWQRIKEPSLDNNNGTAFVAVGVPCCCESHLRNFLRFLFDVFFADFVEQTAIGSWIKCSQSQRLNPSPGGKKYTFIHRAALCTTETAPFRHGAHHTRVRGTLWCPKLSPYKNPFRARGLKLKEFTPWTMPYAMLTRYAMLMACVDSMVCHGVLHGHCYI